ncbi:hypothetical protein NDU88_000535 [Pleurodeles waltl]|uniref:Uncharacterized protein n=1 Tax=Pleurodeles waltl TaxID=8319 RepID=A0AAV7V5B9_PLEWA|nr:hypothetical protein NDU88_000535 [Pleurodeles waltl]
MRNLCCHVAGDHTTWPLLVSVPLACRAPRLKPEQRGLRGWGASEARPLPVIHRGLRRKHVSLPLAPGSSCGEGHPKP